MLFWGRMWKGCCSLDTSSLQCRHFRIGARDRKFELVIVNSLPYWLGKSGWGGGGEGAGEKSPVTSPFSLTPTP